MDFVSTEGYLVKWQDLASGDRFLRFLTPDRGLLEVSAARRKLEESPPLAAPVHLDRARLTLLPRRRRAGARLVDYQLEERNLWLAEDLEAFGGAMLLVEAVERLSAEEDPQPGVWRLLKDLLTALREGADPRRTTLHALVLLLGVLGYAPDFGRCRACGRPPRGRAVYVAGRGGFLHKACRKGDGGLEVSPGTLLYLGRLAGLDLGGARHLGGDRLVQREARELIEAHFNYLCQRRLQAQVFARKLSDLREREAARAAGKRAAGGGAR